MSHYSILLQAKWQQPDAIPAWFVGQVSIRARSVQVTNGGIKILPDTDATAELLQSLGVHRPSKSWFQIAKADILTFMCILIL